MLEVTLNPFRNKLKQKYRNKIKILGDTQEKPGVCR